MTEKTKKKILLVDDDADYLFQQKIFLEENNYDVITAESKHEALNLLKQEESNGPLSLAVIDLMMEEMDTGIVLAYEIKNHSPKLPVIMITAVALQSGIDFSLYDKAKEWIRADSLLAKPVRPEQLLSEIKMLLKE